MPNYALQMQINMTSNLNADAAVNTWSCVADDDAAFGDFIVAVQNFYSGAVGLYSNIVAASGHRLKGYNRADPEPRVPIFDSTWAFGATPTGAPLPPELAVCMSFQGDPESGVSQARKRGRVFLGPVAATNLSTSARPTSSTLTLLAGLGEDLMDAGTTSGTWLWTVHSSSTGDNSPVTNGWVDDEFDIQRRRGRIPTTRTVW